MKTRFNAYEKSTYDFVKKILVECPSCGDQALVKSSESFSSAEKESETRVICTNCGHSKMLSEEPKTRFKFKNGSTSETRFYAMNGNIDPYFKLPLWLQLELPKGLLWAYNYDHLSFIENHISAELRERNLDEISNKSMAVDFLNG
ncbi:MAG: hypothetical protein JKY54_17365 [Flavobacteriales bacterium]|nr:hypothetical protein [Flavobacteriales bacterium]